MTTGIAESYLFLDRLSSARTASAQYPQVESTKVISERTLRLVGWTGTTGASEQARTASTTIAEPARALRCRNIDLILCPCRSGVNVAGGIHINYRCCDRAIPTNGGGRPVQAGRV